MQKNKKIILFAVGVVVFLLFAFLFFWLKNSQNKTIPNPNGQTEQPQTGQIILFYGEECPHCQDLEEWIENNKIKEKISFNSLEVYHNEENLNLLSQKAKICGIDENAIGIPFLWTGETCLIGGDPIQQFFQNNINSQENASENLQTNEIQE